MPDKETTFVCFCHGDPSVGIPGSQATVSICLPPGNDKEDLEFVRAELKAAFTNIFDDKHTHVLTTEELDAMNAAEDKLFDDIDAERDTLEHIRAADVVDVCPKCEQTDICRCGEESDYSVPPPDPAVAAADTLSHDVLVDAAREGAALGTCDED